MRQHPPGLLITGTDAACGKTTLLAGLAASLTAEGFRVQAYKPLEFSAEVSFHRGQDQAYLNKITQQFISAETFTAPAANAVPQVLWNKLLDQCRSMQYPVLLEAPGQIATPWHISGSRLQDSVDMAEHLDMPLLITGRNDHTFLEKMRLALTFTAQRPVKILGFARVQTRPDTGDTPLFDFSPVYLAQQFAVPFLGDLPYSPSISVESLQQGNLIRLTQENIDLFPLQVGIGLTL